LADSREKKLRSGKEPKQKARKPCIYAGLRAF